jgi:hypothetical protein
MKRTLIAAGLVLASGTAFANEGFPQPSFNDGANVAPQLVTSSRVQDNKFPKSYGANLGGPTGPATVLLQSDRGTPGTNLSTWVAPSFSG